MSSVVVGISMLKYKKEKSTLPKLKFKDDKYKAVEFMKKHNNPTSALFVLQWWAMCTRKNILFHILYDLKSLSEAFLSEKIIDWIPNKKE